MSQSQGSPGEAEEASASALGLVTASNGPAIILSLAAIYLIWGSSYLAIRIAIQGIPPLLMAGTRFLLAGVVLYGWLRWRGTPGPTSDEWGAAFKVALLLIVATNGCVVFAEQWVDSGVAAVAFATAPLWMALFAGVWERWPTLLEWIGLVLGFSGVVMLNFHTNMHAHPIAALALIVAALSWALGSIVSRQLSLPQGLMSSAAQMIAGAPVLIGIGLGSGERLGHWPERGAVMALLYLAVFSSLLGYSCYTYLVHHTRPAVAVSHAYVNPVVAVGLGAFLAGEPVNAWELVAMVVTAAAVFFIMRGRTAQQTEATPEAE